MKVGDIIYCNVNHYEDIKYGEKCIVTDTSNFNLIEINNLHSRFEVNFIKRTDKRINKIKNILKTQLN